MKPRTITVLVIGLSVIAAILYDFFAYFFFGVEHTISVVINDWAFSSHPLMSFLTGFIFGGLVVHFFRWKPQ